MTASTGLRAAGPAAIPLVHVEHCMGTVFSIDVRAPGVDPAVIGSAVARLHAIDATYSPFRSTSVISRLAAGTMTLRDAPREVREVLARCDELTEITGGYFSARYNLRIDPSGYVKGWAIRCVSDLLERAGSRNHCVNGGGDVQCVGEPVPGDSWRIGVLDPFDRRALVDVVRGAGRFAVATSGRAERGAHITDPHTGRAPLALASVTVCGVDVVAVDAYATAAFAMGEAGPAWLAERVDVTALVVRFDATVWRSR